MLYNTYISPDRLLNTLERALMQKHAALRDRPSSHLYFRQFKSIHGTLPTYLWFQ